MVFGSKGVDGHGGDILFGLFCSALGLVANKPPITANPAKTMSTGPITPNIFLP